MIFCTVIQIGLFLQWKSYKNVRILEKSNNEAFIPRLTVNITKADKIVQIIRLSYKPSEFEKLFKHQQMV